MSLSSSVYIELRKNRRFGKFTLLVSFFHLTVSQNQLLREVASLPQFFGLRRARADAAETCDC
jgi:hypothetical protein